MLGANLRAWIDLQQERLQELQGGSRLIDPASA